jgi:hypothetical protein
MEILCEERNAMKKALKSYGIKVHAEVETPEFHYREWKYEYSNRGTMNFGGYLEVGYIVEPDTKKVIVERVVDTDKTNPRALNAIVCELDKAIIRTAILSNAYECLTRDGTVSY